MPGSAPVDVDTGGVDPVDAIAAPITSVEVEGGGAATLQVRAHRRVRLTCLADTGDAANLSMLMFAADRLDRLNVPDTLKAQMSARIHPPMVLMSDRGTALASVVGSSLDWHDALCGHSTDAHLERRFGPSSYAQDGNGWRRSARPGLLVELAKYGMGEADLHATVNFFSKVATSDDPAGILRWEPSAAVAGDWVELRAEQDLLLICSAAPHPLDDSDRWAPAGVRIDVLAGAPWDEQDPSYRHRPESARALLAARRILA